MMSKTPLNLVAQTCLPTPLGPMTAAATELGIAVLAFDTPALPGVPEDPGQRWLAALAQQLAAYWEHADRPFSVPLDLQGTDFQREVWRALTILASGQTCSYADIAHRIGRPSAVRAVGAANGANPVAIVVPCHRVIGRDGSLTGYASGLPRKAALLQHESPQRALPAAAA
jgi:methylated-DNA-[protein]-cysteine S-methyltransferase